MKIRIARSTRSRSVVVVVGLAALAVACGTTAPDPVGTSASELTGSVYITCDAPCDNQFSETACNAVATCSWTAPGLTGCNPGPNNCASQTTEEGCTLPSCEWNDGTCTSAPHLYCANYDAGASGCVSPCVWASCVGPVQCPTGVFPVGTSCPKGCPTEYHFLGSGSSGSGGSGGRCGNLPC